MKRMWVVILNMKWSQSFFVFQEKLNYMIKIMKYKEIFLNAM